MDPDPSMDGFNQHLYQPDIPEQNNRADPDDCTENDGISPSTRVDHTVIVVSTHHLAQG
jgi:hypothetical protein